MNVKEIEKLAYDAKARFNTLCQVMTDIAKRLDDQIIEKLYKGHQSFFLDNFVIIYLFALLTIACSDKTLEYNEYVFLRLLSDGHYSLEKCFDDFEKKNHRKGFNYEDFSKLNSQQTKEFLEYYYSVFFKNCSELLVKSIESIKKINIRHYFHTIEECSEDIVHSLLWIDNRSNDQEVENAKKIMHSIFVAPFKKVILDSKYANDKELKNICQTKHNCRSLAELYHIGPQLFERTKGFLVDYAHHPQLLENALIYIETDKSVGSGFIINNEGMCLTCAHVISEAKVIYARVTLENDRKEIHKCKLLYLDKENDYALIKLETKNHYYFAYEESYKHLKLGTEIAIVGYPFGIGLSDDVLELSPTLTKGYISSKQTKNGQKFYYLDALARPGNSGGPVFEAATGKVIGYLCGAYGDKDNKIVFMRSLEEFLKKVSHI